MTRPIEEPRPNTPADRRSRRRPLASETKTVGELEDEGGTDPTESTADPQDPVRQ